MERPETAPLLTHLINVARRYFDALRAWPRPQLSLVCQERGCLVQWNDTEDTWDCPGHGSRFDRHGRVICEPPNQDLEPARQDTGEAADADERTNPPTPIQGGPRMTSKRLIDSRCTAALAIAAALIVFPARLVPAQEDPWPGPAQQDRQGAPATKAPEQAEATTGDAEIMAQVIALDENEVTLARAAQQKNVTGPVQRYAKTIEQDHDRDRQRVHALAEKLGLTLTTTTTVDQLHAKGQEAMSRLAPLTGEQYGRSFMTEMVNGHREALQMIDDFLKTAQNEELKRHLTEARTRMSMHLAEGEKIQGSIGRTDRPAPSSSEARPEPPLIA